MNTPEPTALADQAIATPRETRADLHRRAVRGYTPIRHIFVQHRRVGNARRQRQGGKLGELVNGHQERALDAYLMLLSAEPTLDDDVGYHSEYWARLLSPVDDDDRKLSSPAVSRTWLQLETHGLIERRRVRGHALVRPRREDSKGPYTRPGKSAPAAKGGWPPGDYYFVVPNKYWTDELDQKLPLAGKAMLFIALQATSKNPTFYLPQEEAPWWYGVSAETVQRGVDALRAHDLLIERRQRITAPRAPEGYTIRTHYSLTAPYSTAERIKLQVATLQQVRARATAHEDPAETTAS